MLKLENILKIVQKLTYDISHTILNMWKKIEVPRKKKKENALSHYDIWPNFTKEKYEGGGVICVGQGKLEVCLHLRKEMNT